MKTLADLIARNARFNGPRPAVLCRGRHYTHAEHAARIWRLANALAGLGLKVGDRIAFLSHNRVECLEIYGAAESGGYVAMPLNWRLAAAELGKIVDDGEPSALVYEPRFAGTVAALRETGHLGGCQLIALDEAGAEAADYEALLAAASPSRPAHRPAPADLAHIIYTSGTTGNPKGVMWSQGALLGAGQVIASQSGERPTDRLLVVMPLFHVGAKIEWLAVQTMGGMACVLPGFDPEAVFTAIQDQQLTMAHLAPVMVKTLVDHPGRNAYDLSTLKNIHYGSAPVAEANLRTAVAAFGPVFSQLYGMTEHLSSSILLPHQQVLDGDDMARERLRSAGQPYPGVDIRIVDDTGQELPNGTPGEVALRSDWVMTGYWRNPEATAQAMKDGWLLTGDIGTMDDEGFLYIVDRKKDMIITGGENVYCREVEDTLLLHPAVLDAAVIGVPDPKWGEAVKAFIVLREGQQADEAELIAHCRAHMAAYKRPQTVEFRAEFPRLPHGKTDKKALRAPYWQGAARGVA